MKKNVVKINESTLRQIVAESVEKVLKEGEDEVLNELKKDINYYYTNAKENLESLLKTYESLPEEYSAMRDSNMAMVRNALKSLGFAYVGKKWQENGPSLSMMARYPNVGNNN